MTRRIPSWVVVGVLGSSLVVIGWPTAASSAPQPVVIEGSGDADTAAELVEWQNALLDATLPTEVAFYQRGTVDGRAQLLAGQTQFALSGVPFTAAELAARPKDAGEIIAVPVAISSLAIMVTTPDNVGWSTESLICDPDDPEIEDPEACYVRGVYDGPIRVPAENLGAMMIGLNPAYERNALATWGHPSIVASLGTDDMAIQARSKRHTFVARTESSAANKFLMTYAKALAPAAWDLRKSENPQFDWDALGEQMSSRVVSRYGADTQAGIIAIAKVDAATNSTPDTWSGNMGAIPSNQIEQLKADYPGAELRVVEIQNRAGEYVTPTQQSVSAAVAAGTDPLVAATTEVPGGYPLVWTTRLYTVAGALTPDQANSLAALVRYVATDGQDVAVADGGVALPAAMQVEALAAADRIVAANCTAAGFEVTTGAPAAVEARTPKVRALTDLSYCTAVVPPTSTTTTTIAPTTTIPSTTTPYRPPVTASQYVPPVFEPEPFDEGDPFEGELDPPVEDPAATPSTTVPATIAGESVPTTAPLPAGGGGGRPRAVPLSALPMALPDDGRERFRKLGTLLLGAALFLGVRRPMRRRS